MIEFLIVVGIIGFCWKGLKRFTSSPSSSQGSGISSGDWGRIGVMSGMAWYKKDQELDLLRKQSDEAARQTRIMEDRSRHEREEMQKQTRLIEEQNRLLRQRK